MADRPTRSEKTERRSWVSLVPYGLNEQHPNAYLDILKTAWENRDNLSYAYRVLRDGCCDGCAAPTRAASDACALRAGSPMNGVPDYNAIVEVFPVARRHGAASGAA